MVRRINENGKASRCIVVEPETAMFSEEPPKNKGKRSSFG